MNSVVLSSLFALLAVAVHCEYGEYCPKDKCVRPDCHCMSQEKIFNKLEDNPQFIMLTFDDAVTIANIGTYRELLGNRKNPNGCPIAATFFVSHEYADYSLINELYRKGSEIAVHTVTHHAEVEYWKNGNSTRWYNEVVGMRNMIERFAKIKQSEIVGFRAAFLQTAGGVTFKLLNENNFTWDSSMPTLALSNLPAFPYSLDYGYQQDCQITPCPLPLSSYKGLWEVPLVMWYRNSNTSTTHCSMVDACTPYPTTQSDTLNYFKTNFERHYKENRAPFPVFLHEAWLKNADRKQGYMDFVDWALEKDDVFIVTVKEVLDYLRDPKPVSGYKQKNCPKSPISNNCNPPKFCNYNVTRDGLEVPRIMRSCVRCPRKYPWVDNHYGN